jgi:hypothetical protein
MNLNDLKNEMMMVPFNEPVFLYIGIGAAASEKVNLPPSQYQQCPPFLQEMRNRVPNLHLFLLLIDPYHENPPYVATDYSLVDRYNSECHYRSADDSLQAFVYRLCVYTDPDLQVPINGLNITPVLRDLNEFVKERHFSLLYHDFTGRKTALLAEHFDAENKAHLDHIIYGMSAREDHGCFFDLSEPTAYFPYKVDRHPHRRPLIKMFNYYHYILNKSYPASAVELQTYPVEMQALAYKQKMQIIRVIWHNFKTIHLSLLRQVRKLQLQPAEADQVEENNYLFQDLPKMHREMFTALYNEADYTLLLELLCNYSASALDHLAQLKELDMSGEELLSFITLDEDPYKWYDTAIELL